jgi:UPF0716 family protein affecting phage T7 exclusion
MHPRLLRLHVLAGVHSLVDCMRTGRQRAQDTVEYGLVLVGGALLAVLAYTLFSPIVQEIAAQVQRELTTQFK